MAIIEHQTMGLPLRHLITRFIEKLSPIFLKSNMASNKPIETGGENDAIVPSLRIDICLRTYDKSNTDISLLKQNQRGKRCNRTHINDS